MSKVKLIQYFFMLIGLSLVFLILIGDNKKSNKMEIELSKNYSREISGIVSSANQSRGTITLRLKGHVNHPYYFTLTSNYYLNPYDFDNFAQR